jgi:hypothetical protein
MTGTIQYNIIESFIACCQMTINEMLIFSKIGSDVTDFKHFDYKSHISMISEICCKRSLHLSSGQAHFF